MADVDAALAGGNYEVLRQRLLLAGEELGRRAEALNLRRKAIFGSSEPQLVATERVRTEHNCAPVDIVSVGEQLLLGYNVFLGLKAETTVGDVLALHRFEPLAGAAAGGAAAAGAAGSGAEGGYDCSPLPLGGLGGFLTSEDLRRDFANLYRYTRDARLLQLVKRDTQLLAVFQAGSSWKDLKVLRWRIEAAGDIVYVDDRGDRDYAALVPAPYDFEWIEVTRDLQVAGRHPHYNLLDQLFVETVGGDLTIKVENNTEDGQGIYREPVDDANQSLDDARIYFAPIGKPGGLVLLKVLPFREEKWRYLVFDARSRKVVRADGIGQGCRSLPEDHGVVFPGGHVLVGGATKLFDGDSTDYILERELHSPNGEDVLYVYHRRRDGSYLLYTYNLISKEIAPPIQCNGYSMFADGRMVVFRATSSEPARVHPMQVWQTPFTSAEHAASAAPGDGSYLAKVGNADLVRGLSDALSVARLASTTAPARRTFEDILGLGTRAVDAYHWLGHADTGDLKAAVVEVRAAAKLILDEYEKVVALEGVAAATLARAESEVAERLRATRSESWERIDPFLEALTSLRGLRGQLITLKDTRFIDVARLRQLEAQVIEAFDRVTSDAVTQLARGEAFAELVKRAAELSSKVGALDTAALVRPVRTEIDQVAAGLDLLGEVISTLKIDDTTRRTAILENITDAFGQVNRARATIEGRQRELAAREGRAEFGAQIKLLTQSVASALAQCDTPDKCDHELNRLHTQLEELEARFADVDELTAELAVKREEIVEAVGSRKQTLQAERQRRASNLETAARRILEGVARRASTLGTPEEVNAYFAADPMVQKLRDIGAALGEIGDGVKADELEALLKTARQDALRGQRDRADLFEGSGDLIRLGEHRFPVNRQPLELMIVPHAEGLAVHLAGSDFYEPLDDERLMASRALWDQDLPSESPEVYRGEYLAASILAEAEAGQGALSLDVLRTAAREGTLEALLKGPAQERYDEGYERGVHDHDAARILERLLAMRDGAGLLAHPPAARALAVVYWATEPAPADPAAPAQTGRETALRARWQRAAQSLVRLADAFGERGAAHLTDEITRALTAFVERHPALARAGVGAADAPLGAAYLVRELGAAVPRFVVSGAAVTVVNALQAELDARGGRLGFEDDLRILAGAPGAAMALCRAWVDGVVARRPELAPAAVEAAAYLATPGLAREPSSALIEGTATGLLGRHPRINAGTLAMRLDEMGPRLDAFRRERVPAFRAYRALRTEIAAQQRKRVRLDELRPRVMSSFVRNRLIDQVYLPLIGANLAKQLGAAGAGKRTDQMGMLLLISPPGYGKTTLMEYVAARLGLAFVKVNGPALGHAVTSLDPAEAPNATSRQEIEKVSLALEMGTNVMLYLDDIQHTSPELLQKFISLCDAQRKIEGVWRGQTRTYDLRGKKLCVVMAGNPYTESGETFRIPDMLANRADVYNLGDVLTGRDQDFALSYLENALTSSPTLAPLATRELGDIYKLIRMAAGEPVPTTDLSHGYAAVELEEILTVIRQLSAIQTTLLAVNREYIRSAAQADAFRTEPPFKLQGSYRNMNKLAEKVVAAMTPAELEALVDDHYQSEAQTLTTAAEQNLLKVAELRGRLEPAQAARWAEIKSEYVRQRRMGGGNDDPVTRLVGTLSGLGVELGGIQSALTAGTSGDIGKELRELRHAVAQAVTQASRQKPAPAPAPATRDPEAWLAPRLDALAAGLAARAEQPIHVAVNGNGSGSGSADAKLELVLGQIRGLEQTLVPVVQAVIDQHGGDKAFLAGQMVQIIALLQQLDERLRADGAR